MSESYFGTDGIRGRANTHPVDPQTIVKIGLALGKLLEHKQGACRVLIGKDTRLSGYMIESALLSGLTAMGVNVFLVGPLPTPAVSFLVRSLRADLGVMISASHNLFFDNGIKIFGHDGSKLSPGVEKIVEDFLNSPLESHLVSPEHMGRARRIDDAQARYIEFIKNSFPRNLTLDGMKIVLDCAHGSAYKIAPEIFWELGATVEAIHTQPDGCNINADCGSVFPQRLADRVRASGADVGLAFDGDADRLLVVDEEGSVVEGEQLIARLALLLQAQGRLSKSTVVTTVMANLGLDSFLESQGIRCVRAKVGDRYVSLEMRRGGYCFGAEPSGHLIFHDYNPTSDALLGALQLLAALRIKAGKVSHFLKVFTPIPQMAMNIPLKPGASLDFALEEKINHAQKLLDAEGGRLVVRRSGTESLLRVMGECSNRPLLERVVLSLSGTLAQGV